ncbi:MAG: SAM-dependent methyltransferase [Clostridia bacterium]|nr:SAM-dependent methyltransferase [Clostridia bacterium]
MKNNTDFISLLSLAVRREALKKLVFSRPTEGEVFKITARLVAHRGKRLLAMEYSLPGNTVSQRNVREDEIESVIGELADRYKQINLITTLGEAERRISKKGASVLLGGDALMRRLSCESVPAESALEELDKKKNYILSGDEAFLIKLGISSEKGRIHDKKQGKFRQINRFLEHIEDIYDKLPKDSELIVYDLCCGKSYLSFAVYYYLTEVKGRKVRMTGADLKRDVILWCEGLAMELGYHGMKFLVADISTLELDAKPDMVISLHACDVATDIVLDTALRLNAKIILSTPCCHRYLYGRINSPELKFVTDNPHISVKLCEALTDSLRVLKLRAGGYSVSALELTDPENTPKNTLIRAIRNTSLSEQQLSKATEEYNAALRFVMGDGADGYLKDILQ